MEIDYDYLRTGTAIGFRASRELCSNYLFCFVLHVPASIFRPYAIVLKCFSIGPIYIFWATYFQVLHGSYT